MDGYGESRIKTVHTYDEVMATEVSNAIINGYFSMFISLQSKLEQLINE